jgi:hypothetical protein
LILGGSLKKCKMQFEFLRFGKKQSNEVIFGMVFTNITDQAHHSRRFPYKAKMYRSNSVLLFKQHQTNETNNL